MAEKDTAKLSAKELPKEVGEDVKQLAVALQERSDWIDKLQEGEISTLGEFVARAKSLFPSGAARFIANFGSTGDILLSVLDEVAPDSESAASIRSFFESVKRLLDERGIRLGEEQAELDALTQDRVFPNRIQRIGSVLTYIPELQQPLLDVALYGHDDKELFRFCEPIDQVSREASHLLHFVAESYSKIIGADSRHELPLCESVRVNERENVQHVLKSLIQVCGLLGIDFQESLKQATAAGAGSTSEE